MGVGQFCPQAPVTMCKKKVSILSVFKINSHASSENVDTCASI